MLIYVLICLCLFLTGIVGFQFFYMIYLERISKEHKNRIRELEQHSIKIAGRLRDAESRIIDQDNLLASNQEELPGDEEIWADVIDDR